MSHTQIGPGQLAWRKATRSMNNGDCVEVAAASGKIAVRDSRDPDGKWLSYSAQPWRAFIAKVKVE